MQIKPLPYDLTVCKLASEKDIPAALPFCFTAVTDEEISLVCPTAAVPAGATHHEEGWKAFRIAGTLDFSLIGILAAISALLAAQQIGIFAVSTFNTDYILVKERDFDKALTVLAEAGYTVL